MLIQVGSVQPEVIHLIDNVSNYDYNLANNNNRAAIGTIITAATRQQHYEELFGNSFDYVSGPIMNWTGNYQYLTVKYSGYVDLVSMLHGLTRLQLGRITIQDRPKQGFVTRQTLEWHPRTRALHNSPFGIRSGGTGRLGPQKNQIVTTLKFNQKRRGRMPRLFYSKTSTHRPSSFSFPLHQLSPTPAAPERSRPHCPPFRETFSGARQRS